MNKLIKQYYFNNDNTPVEGCRVIPLLFGNYLDINTRSINLVLWWFVLSITLGNNIPDQYEFGVHALYDHELKFLTLYIDLVFLCFMLNFDKRTYRYPLNKSCKVLDMYYE